MTLLLRGMGAAACPGVWALCGVYGGGHSRLECATRMNFGPECYVACVVLILT